MKDKEKQIEEMAKDIPYLTLDRTVFVGATETKNVSWMLSEEDNKMIAEELIKKGWVKPYKDSVVLSREEYEDLRLLEEKYGKPSYIDGCMTAYAHRLETANNLVSKASKETAEKYHKFINNSIKHALSIHGTSKPVTICSTIRYDNDEIAKQFGVEIKE